MTFRKRIRRQFDRVLNGVGWDLRRFPEPYYSYAWRRHVLLNALDVDLVVDVGANSGQYGEELRKYGYIGDILSLEPTSEAFRELGIASSGDVRWSAIQSAAGTEEGTVEINVSVNSTGSSVLPQLERNLAASPSSKYESLETVPIGRLDEIAGDVVGSADQPFLKIDTQGYEKHVLEGARGILEHLAGLEIELSLVELYDGQLLWREQIEYLEERGFGVVGLSGGFWDRKTGKHCSWKVCLQGNRHKPIDFY